MVNTIANTTDVLEHINRYEKKVGTSFLKDWDLEYFPFVILFPDGSFSTYGVSFNALEVGPTCCGLKKVLNMYIKIARRAGLKVVRTMTTRNPKAYAKLSGGTLVSSTEKDNGKTEYVFELEV
jgi:hypothetical protein